MVSLGGGEELPTQYAPLKELERHCEDFMVVSGLAQDFARSHGNGGGDHARATATYLTGSCPKKTAGADIQLGISVDQIAAQKIGHLTRLPSLELSADGQRSAGRCDSGYSCAYQFNLAWKNGNSADGSRLTHDWFLSVFLVMVHQGHAVQKVPAVSGCKKAFSIPFWMKLKRCKARSVVTTNASSMNTLNRCVTLNYASSVLKNSPLNFHRSACP